MRSSIVLVLLLLLAAACTREPVENQARALGDREFAPERWAVASTAEREHMVASFLAKHPPDRLTTQQVKQLLGEPTGYYDYDENLAYLIGPATVESQYGKERMLVFITDKRTGNVEEVELVPPLK
ncbi:hypothetical protein [Massilia sp. DD77]|uniref:hypothetical protein n=1 Tax=Massilia sp. DD77 TaxID=3109349 RepID=UPI002FFFE6BB